jgi:hypothetical protein
MGLLDKVRQQQKVSNNLDATEIEFILSLIKNSNFKGENLDILYKIAVKLQNQYTDISK